MTLFDPTANQFGERGPRLNRHFFGERHWLQLPPVGGDERRNQAVDKGKGKERACARHTLETRGQSERG